MSKYLNSVSAFVFFTLTVLCFVPSYAHAQSVNLIANPSLETAGTGGVPLSWKKTYWGSVVPTFSYPVAGRVATEKAASITLSRNTGGDARWEYTAVTVEAGQTYVFSNWYKSNAVTELDVTYTKSNGTLSYDLVATIPSSVNVWKQTTATIIIPADVTRVVVYHLLKKKGTLTVDEFALSKVGTTTPPILTPALTFAASPLLVTVGSSSTLTWASANVKSCVASNGWTGTKVVSGSEVVSPSATTTYVLTCTGAGGSISKQVTVAVQPLVVVPPPVLPTLSFVAAPSSIIEGATSTLSWTSTNSTSCTASLGWSGGKILSGSEIVSPTATTTYSLSCTGVGGVVSKEVTVAVKSIVVVPPPPPPSSGVWSEGMVTLSFDDSWISQYTAVLPIMETAGIKGTFYITTQPLVEGWTDFMTPVQVQAIAQKGHEIGGHTITHPHLPQLSSANLTKELVDSKLYLEGLVGTAVTTLAYPYGEFNATVKSATNNAGYTTGRGVDEEVLNVPTTDKFNLQSSCILKSTPFSVIKQAIDDAKANKQWYIICMHEVKTGGDEYSITPTQFQQIVDYIKLSGIKVVTVKEGTALMAN